MKFVDEVSVEVRGGNGGSGCVGFRREKFIPFGGPNGGDGGHGGDVVLVATEGINTLVDFRYKRIFQADHGERGQGWDCAGKAGELLEVLVPIGTLVFDRDQDELIGDLTAPGERLLVAKGGARGLGNARFKSSTNRTPRQFTPGKPGEIRFLKLELKLLADVGLLGLPNAGKSTLVASVSQARPKIADYPFTTLYPQLGVVSISPGRSFVMADIPGLIEGAAEGAGLGIQFLKHVSRTRLLLHLVDISVDTQEQAEAVRTIEAELEKFSPELAREPRWLVATKSDLLPAEDAQKCLSDLCEALAWTEPGYIISAISKRNTEALCKDIMAHLERLAEAPVANTFEKSIPDESPEE